MTTTSRAESWEVVVSQLVASTSVTDQLNGLLARSVEPDLVAQLGLGVSKRRLLFVPREQPGAEKSYVLASFIDADTYEFVLVNQGTMQRADRCGSAIRVEVLAGFLRDLVSLATPEPEEVSPPVEEPPAPEAPVLEVAAPPDGWVRPAPIEFL